MRALDAPHLTGIRLRSGDWQARRDDLKRLIAAGRRITELRAKFEGLLIADAWDQDLLTERQHFVAYGSKWWRILSGNYRRARGRLAGLCAQPLPKRPQDCVEIIDAVLEERKDRQVYQEYQTLGESLFGAQWQREYSDWKFSPRLASGFFSSIRTSEIVSSPTVSSRSWLAHQIFKA